MYKIFHPLFRYWIIKIILSLSLAALVLFFAFERIVICAIWPVIFLALTLIDMHILRHTVLKLDEQSLLFRRGKSKIHLLWKDVLMVRQTKQAKSQVYLELGVQQETFAIPISNLDIDQVLYWVNHYAPSDALQKDAYKRLSAYQEWSAKAQRLVSNQDKNLAAGYSLGMRILISFLFIFFVGIGSGLWLILDSIAVILCFGPIIVIFGSWVISSIFYRAEMTSEEITVISLWGKQQIRWDEVEYIEHDFGQRRFILYGQKKRLAVTNPRLLVGQDRAEMIDMLQAQIEHHKIELHHKERALFTWSRNVTERETF